jgi:cytoskeleton protein RodZ
MSKVTHLTLDEGGGLNRRRIHLREISGDADTPLETVGQDLRAARLRRGDDLATVSRALKIRKDHLEALEEDRFEALPGRTYAVGFVRSYSDYLGLDAVQSVERFKREIAGRGEIPMTGAISPDIEEQRKLPHGWVVIAVVVLGLIVYGAYHLAITADTLLKPAVAPVPERMAAKPPPPVQTPKPAPVATPAPQVTASVPPNSQTTTQPASNAQTAPAPADGLAALPAGQVYGAQNKDARVVLHAKETTRILVEATDGTVYINRTLHPGDSYRVPDRVGLTLTTPNGGAIALELDGQLMGAAGKGSQMTEALSLDPQAIVDRSNGNSG